MPACTRMRRTISRRPRNQPASEGEWSGPLPSLIPVDTMVMRHRREWFIEMMQPPLPFLIFRRLAKADLVRIERCPAHQQQEFVRALDAAAEFARLVPRHGSNDAPGLGERDLKFLGLTRANR